MKVCSKCGQNKDPTEFSKRAGNKKDGIRPECKKCQAVQTVIDTYKKRDRNMNNGRFASIYNGLQQNLKKVYDVVPIREAWGESMVMAELSRLGMSYSGDKPIIGMLNRLKDLGLIKEMEPGKFLREPITEKVEKKEPKPATIESKDHMIKETKTPIAQLNDLAMQAIQIANLCKKLAGDIETAAINIDDHVAFTQKDSLKLKQLQELLKG